MRPDARLCRCVVCLWCGMCAGESSLEIARVRDVVRGPWSQGGPVPVPGEGVRAVMTGRARVPAPRPAHVMLQYLPKL